jgi:hypothetical protein
MKQDMLSSRSQVWCGGCCYVVMMMMVNYGGEEGIYFLNVGFIDQSGSRNSMFSTYGTRDIISLVTPRLGVTHCT